MLCSLLCISHFGSLLMPHWDLPSAGWPPIKWTNKFRPRENRTLDRSVEQVGSETQMLLASYKSYKILQAEILWHDMTHIHPLGSVAAVRTSQIFALLRPWGKDTLPIYILWTFCPFAIGHTGVFVPSWAQRCDPHCNWRMDKATWFLGFNTLIWRYPKS